MQKKTQQPQLTPWELVDTIRLSLAKEQQWRTLVFEGVGVKHSGLSFIPRGACHSTLKAVIMWPTHVAARSWRNQVLQEEGDRKACGLRHMTGFCLPPTAASTHLLTPPPDPFALSEQPPPASAMGWLINAAKGSTESALNRKWEGGAAPIAHAGASAASPL